MKLLDWLKSEKISQREFSKRIGTTPSAVSQWINGSRKPSQKMLLKIILETRQSVRVEDF